MSLTANGSLSIVQMSINMLNSHYNGVELHTGKVTTLQNCGCLSRVSVTHASYRHVSMSTHQIRCNVAGAENAENS